MTWLSNAITAWHGERLPDRPGVFRPTTRVDAVARARRMTGSAGAAIRYRLKDHQGGRDPHATDCASHWKSLIKRIDLATADCAGFIAWALGFDRFQPDAFATYGGWINCDSALIDARTVKSWFEEVDWANPDPVRRIAPLAGDVVVFPSIDVDRDGKRDRVGHIGVITEVLPSWAPNIWGALRVAHCSGGNDKRIGRAIAETTAIPWSGATVYRGVTRSAWGATILRYRRFAPF